MDKVIVDCSTGETTVVPLTAEEIEAIELAAQQAEEEKARQEEAADAKEAARAEILAKLGLTEEEAAVLLG
jgi:hypothetical protein